MADTTESLNLDFTKLDFNGIKTSLKELLKEDGVITDFDYEGSNTDSLLNIMAYVNTMINHNLNYIGNEMFIETATQRKSILRHANAMGYTVERKVSAKFDVTLQFNLEPYRKFTIPKYTEFKTSDGTTFLLQEEKNYTNNTDKTINILDSVTLTEGTLITPEENSLDLIFDINTNKIMTIPYTDIENGSIEVTEIYGGDVLNKVFTESIDLLNEIHEKKPIFISKYDPDTEYVRIRFLNDYGIGPANNSEIQINFIISKGASGNNYTNLKDTILEDTSININDLSRNEVTIISNPNGKSYGGADEETTESIKENISNYKDSGGRAITPTDWEVILNNRPEILKSNVWGGDSIGDNLLLDTFKDYQKEALKKLGNVYITALPATGNKYFSLNFIAELQNFLKNNSVVALRRNIIQPIYLNFDLVITVTIDTNIYGLSEDVIKTSIKDITSSYLDTNFDLIFKEAKLLNEIYSIYGIDSVSLNGTTLSLEIQEDHFIDDTQDNLDINLPVRPNKVELGLNKISGMDGYSFRFEDIGDGISTSTPFDYDPYVDNFLNSTGIQLLNLPAWRDTITYQPEQKVMYNDVIYNNLKKDNLALTFAQGTDGDINTTDSITQFNTPSEAFNTDAFVNYTLYISNGYNQGKYNIISNSSDYVIIDGSFSDFVFDTVYSATTNSNTIINTTGTSYTVDELIGMSVIIKNGSDTGTYPIVSNTADTITIDTTLSSSETNITLQIVQYTENNLTYTIKENPEVSVNWEVITKTSNYMDKWGYPIDFSNYKRIVLNFTNYPVWTSGTYNKNDVVTYNGIYYISSIDNNTTDPTDSSWVQIDTNPEYVAENDIIIGTYMLKENIFRLHNRTPRKQEYSVINAYDSATTYNRGEAVSYSGNNYYCRFDSTTNIDPTNIDSWIQFDNVTKFNKDLFKDKLYIVFDDTSSNFDFSLLKLKKELVPTIRTESIFI